MYTTLATCKTPHLAQTDQARLTRFLALRDSNTSPRVTISVLGRVVVSQTCMEQVSYAAVTGKYFRALILHTNACRCVYRHECKHTCRNMRSHVICAVCRCMSRCVSRDAGTHTHTRTHAHTHTRTHTHTRARTCAHAHTRTRAHTHTRTHGQTNARVHARTTARIMDARKHARTHARTCTLAHTSTHARACAHERTYARTCACASTCTCTCTWMRDVYEMVRLCLAVMLHIQPMIGVGRRSHRQCLRIPIAKVISFKLLSHITHDYN